MIRQRLRTRFWVESIAALLTGALTILTIVRRDWIELIFGVEPDQGSGSLEIAVTVGAALLTLILIAAARSEWRRRRLLATS